MVPLSLRLRLRSAIPVSVFLLATLLILRGLSLGIPYVSPDTNGRQTVLLSQIGPHFRVGLTRAFIYSEATMKPTPARPCALWRWDFAGGW